MISIDPGTKAIGIAMWDEGELAHADLLRLPCEADLTDLKAWKGDGPVVVETMVHYADGAGRSRKVHAAIGQDLLDVQWVSGFFGGLFWPAEVVRVEARTWKGSVPKDVTHRRVLKALSPEEKGRIAKVPASLLHNVYDAIGIGLWHLRRLDNGR